MSLKKSALVVLLAALLATPAARGASRLDDLAWLLGGWQRQTRRGTAVEEWTRLGERVFEGKGYVVSADGARRTLEELLLVEMGGEIFYMPKVEENPYPVPFRMTALEGRVAVFENPAHDFPKKISYELEEDGTLVATIEGPGEDGAPRKIEFRFTRP